MNMYMCMCVSMYESMCMSMCLWIYMNVCVEYHRRDGKMDGVRPLERLMSVGTPVATAAATVVVEMKRSL